MTTKKLTPGEIDDIGARLDELAIEEADLRATIRKQIECFGFTPPRSEKSRRIEGTIYECTLSEKSSVVINDVEVGKIENACEAGLFMRLFVKVTKFKLHEGATLLLAGALPEDAPHNLRKMFSSAVQVVQQNPGLTVKLKKQPKGVSTDLEQKTA